MPRPVPTIRRNYADTSWGQLHYAEAGHGPVLLMLHQTPRSHDEFAELQTLLADGYRTVAMDMLGFGASAPLEAPLTIEAMADAAIALLDALDVGAAVILGHHTGAVVAQEMAVRAPDRVDALVLSAMPWVARPREVSRREIGVDDADVSDDGRHLTDLWEQRRRYYPTGRPDLLNRFIRDALVPGLDPLEGHRAVNRYAMAERISAVVAPVLLVVPTADPFAVEALAPVRDGLVNARRVDICHVAGGLIPVMEHAADRVADAVRRFHVGSVTPRGPHLTGEGPHDEGRTDV